MKDYSLYEKPDILDVGFPVKINYNTYNNSGLAYYNHWHEQLEVLYFIDGKAIIECDSKSIEAGPGDLIFINSNEIHGCYCTTNSVKYYCIIFDSTFLKGGVSGNCEEKYITPIAQNLIQFKNIVTGDADILDCVESIVMEYQNKIVGYELFIKSLAYKFLGILYRSHIEKILTEKEYAARMNNLERLNKVISYIQKNYMNEISLDQLAKMLCISRYHFCHIFNKLTGKGVNEYINLLRIEQAEKLIKNTDMNITEISMAVGFNDANYFSRIFTKHKKEPPSYFRKNK